MTIGGNRVQWHRLGMMVSMVCLAWMYGSALQAQSEQVVEVMIKDYRFVTKQATLRLGFPTVIKVRNEDAVRHDFGSTMFEGIPTQIEQDGVVVYGRGVGGVFLDPQHDVTIRFDMTRPGRQVFRCSIHSTMSGELLLLSAEAV